VFGSVWFNATSGTPYTNFAKSLDCSEFEFGLLAAIPYLASLASLPASLLTEATGRRKLIFLLGLYGQRLLWVPITLLPLWLVHHHGGHVTRTATLTFIALVLLMQLTGAVGGPAWTSWMADIVPERARGTYFANRRMWGTVSAIPSAIVAGLLLDAFTVGTPTLTSLGWCAAILIAAAAFGVADIATFHWVREVPRRPQTGAHLLRAMRGPLRDRQFLRFGAYVATLTFAISFMGQFVTLYILDILSDGGGAPVAHTNTLTQVMVVAAPALAQLVVFPVWGRCADRMGKRPLLILAGLGLVPVAAGWCFVTRDRVWLGYVLSALGAAFWAGVEVANLNLVLEMSASGDQADGADAAGGSGYVAVNAVIINLAGCLGGLASGAIAQFLKDAHFQWVTPLKTFTFYDVLFALSAVLRLLAVVLFIPHIHESAARPAHEALRYMTSNIYNNLLGAAVQPVRLLRSTVFREPGS
jgi:MFS family permease